MIDPKIRSMIYDFVIKNQHLTLAQMTQTINRILMIDICENTVKRIMGDEVTRKRGRPKKFG
jgi:hypothetical protein